MAAKFFVRPPHVLRYIIPLSSIIWVVGVDDGRCPYAKWIHDGTENKDGSVKMEAREFLGDPVRELRAIIEKTIRAEIITAIRMVGRA